MDPKPTIDQTDWTEAQRSGYAEMCDQLQLDPETGEPLKHPGTIED